MFFKSLMKGKEAVAGVWQGITSGGGRRILKI
jgi:hypothetical protein